MKGSILCLQHHLDECLIMINVIAIIEILAWPLIALAIVWMIRKPLASLLPAIQKIKIRDFEVEFQRQLKESLEEISRASDVGINGDHSDERLSDVLKLSPDQALLAAWSALENCAREKVEDLLPNDESFKSPLERPLDYLEYKGALTPTTAKTIRDLRSLRNQVVHFGKDLVVRENALQYVSVAERTMKVIGSIAELPRVKLTGLTLFVLELNVLIDSKQFEDVTINEVYEWIRNENVIQSLAERAKGRVDLSSYGADGPYRNFVPFYHEKMKRLYEAYGGDHAKKWGVENQGLCLLLAWTNELIQQGSGWHPYEM